MLAPDDKLKFSVKPYLAATPRFASGADTPRDFLERCLADLAALEPRIGAFVALNLERARATADESTARWRAGRPLSKIDGMPIGIKDIIETADMPTALGTQVIGSTIRPASYCGCIGFKVTVGALNRGGSYDGLSQSATGVLASTLEDAWQVAREIAARAGGDPGYPGLFGPDAAPAPRQPRRLAFLETAGWASASPGAKEAIADAIARIKAAGVDIVTRQSHPKVAGVEAAIAEARPLSMRINGWESRWPLNA